MHAANIRSRGSNAAAAEGEYLDNFVHVERVSDTDTPILSPAVLPEDLDITACFDIEILEALFA